MMVRGEEGLTCKMSPAWVPKSGDLSMMKSCSFSVVHSILHVALNASSVVVWSRPTTPSASMASRMCARLLALCWVLRPRSSVWMRSSKSSRASLVSALEEEEARQAWVGKWQDCNEEQSWACRSEVEGRGTTAQQVASAMADSNSHSVKWQLRCGRDTAIPYERTSSTRARATSYLHDLHFYVFTYFLEKKIKNSNARGPVQLSIPPTVNRFQPLQQLVLLPTIERSTIDRR